jgi:putative ABC transport system permease protein
MALPLSYHWRHLLARRTTTVLTVLVIAAVVGTQAWILGFSVAFSRSLAVASDDHKIIVIRRGASAETSSALPVEEFNRLIQLTSLAVDPNTHEPLVSPELMVQIALPRRRDNGQTTGNVAVRGVTEAAFRVHDTVELRGPLFSKGAQEVIVGVKAAEQFMGLQVGDAIRLGYGNNREYKVVGFFAARGGPLESEIWTYLPSLQSAHNRDTYSSAALRVRDDVDPHKVVEEIAGPAIGLTAQTERDYWNAQTSRIRDYRFLVTVLVSVMAMAAAMSVANTMFTLVAGRTREIAMLRTIGFSGRQIMTGFVLEAMMLTLAGGVVGCLACQVWLDIVGHAKDMYAATNFTTLAFDIRLTPQIMVCAISTVITLGIAGALWPAWRAARVEVVRALREV